MAVNLENLMFQTAEGIWRTEYIEPPNEPIEGDKITCRIRFKWIDPNNPENRATPERHLRLETYDMHEAYDGYAAKLMNAIGMWIDSTEEPEAVYKYPSILLESPGR